MPTTTEIDSPALSRLHDRLTRETRAEVCFDRGRRGLYATDASLYQIEPVGVVVPRTVEDVVATVRIAAEEGVAIVPAGRGHEPLGPDDRAGDRDRLLEVPEPDRRRRPRPR